MKYIRLILVFIFLLCLNVACSVPANGGEHAPVTEDPGEPFVSIPGVSDITLLTEVKGAGEKPLLQWEPVAVAVRYQIIVYDEAGQPYWAWEGSTSQIYLGGTESQPHPESNGPSIEARYSWVVVAYDVSGNVSAASPIRPISP